VRGQRISQLLLTFLILVCLTIIELLDNLAYPDLGVMQRQGEAYIFERVFENLLSWVVRHKVEIHLESGLRDTNVHGHELLHLFGCRLAVMALDRALVLSEEQILDH
jgi:hypothetical protein